MEGGIKVESIDRGREGGERKVGSKGEGGIRGDEE